MRAIELIEKPRVGQPWKCGDEWALVQAIVNEFHSGKDEFCDFVILRFADGHQSQVLLRELMEREDEPTTDIQPAGHTPGPWRIVELENPDGTTYQEIESDGFTVAMVYPSGEHENARLIAAAPALLVACKLAQRELNNMGCECDCENAVVSCLVCAVNQAIAQAEGRE